MSTPGVSRPEEGEIEDINQSKVPESGTLGTFFKSGTGTRVQVFLRAHSPVLRKRGKTRTWSRLTRSLVEQATSMGTSCARCGEGDLPRIERVGEGSAPSLVALEVS